MSENALVGGEHEMAELSGWEDVVGPLLEVTDQDIITWGDDSAFVEAAYQLYHNLLWSVVIDDLELSDVVVLLHDFEEFEEHLWAGLQKDLLLSLSLGVDDCLKGICENVDFDHFVDN